MPKSISCPLGMIGQGLALGPLDLLELVDRGAFAVIGAADPLGEQLSENKDRSCANSRSKECEPTGGTSMRLGVMAVGQALALGLTFLSPSR